MRKRTGAGRRLNKTEIADVFGVSLQTVEQWVRKGLACEKSAREVLFNSAQVVSFLERQAEIRAAESAKPADLEEARARKLAAEAELAEIAVAKARGAVVEIDVVARVVSEEYAATRAKLLSLPSKLGPMAAIETSATACQELIERGIVEALEELSGDGDVLARDVEGGDRRSARGELEAAAEADD